MTRYIRYLYYLLLFMPIIGMVLAKYDVGRDPAFYIRLFFGVFGVFLLVEMISQGKRITIPKGTILLLFYALYQLLWGFINGTLDRRGVMILINNVHIQTILMLIVAYNSKITDKQYSIMMRLLFYTIGITAIVSIYQIYNPGFLYYLKELSESGSIYTIRRTSIFGNLAPLELGLSFLPILAVMTVELFSKGKNSVIPILIMGGIVSVLSNTRWIMGGYALILSMVVFQYRGEMMGRLRTIILSGIVLIALVYLVGFLGYDFNRFWDERLLAEGSLEQTTRYRAFENFARFFPQNPWFGVGVGQTEEIRAASAAVGSSQIHVGYLAHLVSYGIIGSLFLFGFLFRFATMLYKNARKTGHWGSFFGFMVFIWGNATFVHFGLFYYGMILLFVFDKYYLDQYQKKTYAVKNAIINEFPHKELNSLKVSYVSR